MEKNKEEQAYALRIAIQMGCSGAHRMDGKWHPCKTHEEMEEISNGAEQDSWYGENTIGALRERDKLARAKGKSAIVEAEKRGAKRKPKKGKRWDKLAERGGFGGGIGIGTLPGGGLYGLSGVAGKQIMVPSTAPRDNDNDVFIDPNSARTRASQLGCIGISRRISKTGKTVWTPCTNASDLARRAGTTALGRRGKVNRERQAIRTIVNQELKKRKKR